MPSAVRCEGIRIKEGRQDFITSVLGTWFCAVNQAYFTGLFLCISDYFVPGSYDRKGVGRFLKERLIRLGIPLAVFSWMINRLFLYGAQAAVVLETLLIFSPVYVLWRLLTPPRPAIPAVEPHLPGTGAVALFALWWRQRWQSQRRNPRGIAPGLDICRVGS